MQVNLRIKEPWCQRDLLVEMPLTNEEEAELLRVVSRSGFTWPSIRLTVIEPPEQRWTPAD